MTQYLTSGSTSTEIAADIEAAVVAGTLRPGDRLPTVRALSSSTGVSPATASAAYRRLRERGLVHSDGRRGTKVAPGIPPAPTPTPTTVSRADRGRTMGAPNGARDLANGNPDPALLPDMSAVFACLAGPPVLYGSERDVSELVARGRESFRRDGIDARSMTLSSGALDGVERVLSSQLRAGDPVAVEDPGYSAAIDLVSALGLVPAGCAIDDEGMLPEPLEAALRRGAKCVLLTPRAHNPTGAATSTRRAVELRSVLDGFPSVVVVEDDHAGPVAGAPLNLCGIDRERWAVVRSVSKWLGPDLRLAILAGDPTTIGRVDRRHALGAGWVSRLLQVAADRLWEQAGSGPSSLLERAAVTYGARRRALVDALAREGIGATGRSGLNVWVPVPEEASVCARLATMGWTVRAGERYRLRSAPAVRVTISTLSESEAPQLAEAISIAVRGDRRIHSA